MKIKPGDNSYKLENEIRQIVCLLYHHNKITKKLHINLIKSFEKMGVHLKDNKLIIAELKTIHFVIPKDVCNNLKYKNDSIIKHNEVLVEHIMKSKISRLLFKSKHVNDIHEHEKQ